MKNESVHFITDFGKLNKMVVHKPFALPKISEVALDLERFMYAKVLDYKMG